MVTLNMSDQDSAARVITLAAHLYLQLYHINIIKYKYIISTTLLKLRTKLDSINFQLNSY